MTAPKFICPAKDSNHLERCVVSSISRQTSSRNGKADVNARITKPIDKGIVAFVPEDAVDPRA